MGANAESYQAAEEALARNPHHADGHPTLGQFMLLDSLPEPLELRGACRSPASRPKESLVARLPRPAPRPATRSAQR